VFVIPCADGARTAHNVASELAKGRTLNAHEPRTSEVHYCHWRWVAHCWVRALPPFARERGRLVCGIPDADRWDFYRHRYRVRGCPSRKVKASLTLDMRLLDLHGAILLWSPAFLGQLPGEALAHRQQLSRWRDAASSERELCRLTPPELVPVAVFSGCSVASRPVARSIICTTVSSGSLLIRLLKEEVPNRARPAERAARVDPRLHLCMQLCPFRDEAEAHSRDGQFCSDLRKP
jgi:hypothetical protein